MHMSWIRRILVSFFIPLIFALFTAYLFEFGLETYKSYNSKKLISKIEKLREKSVEAYPVAFPSDQIQQLPGFQKLSFDPILISAIPNVTTVYCNESGDWFVYRSDKFGFNNSNEIYDTEDKLTIFVGDSFVHGACTPKGEGIVDIFNKSSPAVNLGMGGSGPLAQYANMKEFGLPIAKKAKEIIWVFYEGNDLVSDLIREKSYLGAYLDPSYLQINYIKNINEVAKSQKEYINEFLLKPEGYDYSIFIKTFKLKNIRNLFQGAFRSDNGSEVAKWQRKNFELSKQLYIKIISNFRELSKGVPVRVIYLPVDIRYCGSVYGALKKLYEEQELWVKEQVLKQGFKFQSASEIINEKNINEIYYYNTCSNRGNGSHFNKFGNEMIVKLIQSSK